MSKQEMNILHRQFISQGMSSAEAWKKVDEHVRGLKNMKKRKGFRFFRKTRTESKDVAVPINIGDSGRKNLMEGLG